MDNNASTYLSKEKMRCSLVPEFFLSWPVILVEGMSNVLFKSWVFQDPANQKKKEKENTTAPVPEHVFCLEWEDILYLNLPSTKGSPPLSHLLLKEPSHSEDKQEDITTV